MKIYRSITIDMTTGETVAENAFEYQGPLALLAYNDTDHDGPGGMGGSSVSGDDHQGSEGATDNDGGGSGDDFDVRQDIKSYYDVAQNLPTSSIKTEADLRQAVHDALQGNPQAVQEYIDENWGKLAGKVYSGLRNVSPENRNKLIAAGILSPTGTLLANGLRLGVNAYVENALANSYASDFGFSAGAPSVPEGMNPENTDPRPSDGGADGDWLAQTMLNSTAQNKSTITETEQTTVPGTNQTADYSGALMDADPHGLKQYVGGAEDQMRQYVQGVTDAGDLANKRQGELYDSWTQFNDMVTELGGSILDDFDSIKARAAENESAAGPEYDKIRSEYDLGMDSVPGMNIQLPAMMGGGTVPIAPGAWGDFYSQQADTRRGISNDKYGVKSDMLGRETEAVRGKGAEASNMWQAQSNALQNKEVITTNDLAGTMAVLEKANLPLEWAFQMLMADKTGSYANERAKIGQGEGNNWADTWLPPAAYVMASS